MPNITSITPPRVPLTDPRTGLITREWYRFFVNLFTLTGNGTTDVSLQDLQLAPNSMTPEVLMQLNDLYNEINTQTRNELGTLSSVNQDNVRYLGFQTVPSLNYTPPVGTVYWNGGTTLTIQNTANVAQPVGEAQYYYVKASAAITKGQLVMLDGAVGASGVLKGKPATSVTIGDYLMGIAAENIALNGFGIVTSFGLVRGFNTTGSPYGETWADGDILYYNPAVPGGLTKTIPAAPNVKAIIAAVVNAATAGSGSVFVRVSFGSKLGETDSNVQFGTLNDGDIIQYDSTLTYWKNVPLSTDVSFTPIIQFGGASTGVTYTTQIGRYTKIGRFVHLYIRIVLSNKGSSTGDVTVVAGTGSFPTAGDNSVGSFDPAANMAGLTAGGAVIPVISSTTLNLVQQTTTGRANLTDTNFTNTSDFRLTLCYAV